MFMIAIKYGTSMVRRLRDEEDGLALTEYLILLGLLTAVVVGAVLAFGNALGDQWALWADWLTGLDAPPELGDPPVEEPPVEEAPAEGA
jgi:pilus assembly protein Flp/PilA